MGVFRVEITGDKEFKEQLKKMVNAKLVLDPVFGRVAADSSGRLKRATPKKEGMTANAWGTPIRIGLSDFENVNRSTVQGVKKKYNLIDILDQGRGEVVPILAKRLYIPLTKTGRAKRPGGSVDGLVYGKDYIFAKSSRATVGKKFMDPEIEKIGQDLVAGIQKKINEITGG